MAWPSITSPRTGLHVPSQPTTPSQPLSTSTAPPPPPPQQQQQQEQEAAAAETQSTAKPNPYLENDPSRTGFDPRTKWWVSYFHILTGRITPEGVFHYREARLRAHEARDVRRAQDFRDWLLTYSPTILFLNDRIAELNHGRRMDASNILCRRCPARLTPDGRVERQGGGFDPQHGILICSDAVRNRGHLEDTLAHEMVHAYDHLRWEVDFRGERDLRQAACTEIRASMLSGECRFMREFWTRQNWKITQEFQNCVRRRAVNSLMARPWCKDDVHAVRTVNEVWDSCFSDTRPFDEVYR